MTAEPPENETVANPYHKACILGHHQCISNHLIHRWLAQQLDYFSLFIDKDMNITRPM